MIDHTDGPRGRPSDQLNKHTMTLIRTLLAATGLAACFAANAQEADIRKVLAERIPQMEKIDEVRPTAMKGLYEVRIGTDLFYTDAKGDYVIQGELIGGCDIIEDLHSAGELARMAGDVAGAVH